MHDPSIILPNIKWMLQVVSRIERRISRISGPSDFVESEFGLDMLDAICMMLLELGESVKRLEKADQGQFIQSHPEVPWKKIVGTRNFIGHGYIELNERVIFEICKTHIPEFKMDLIRIIDKLNTDDTQFT